MYRGQSISLHYEKTGLFKADLFTVGNQAMFEWEQDLTAMKSALFYLKEHIEQRGECGQPMETELGIKGYDMMLKKAYECLLKRISKYNCPNLNRSGQDCPLKEKCTIPKCRDVLQSTKTSGEE